MALSRYAFFPGLVLSVLIVVHYFSWKLGKCPKRFADNAKTNQLWLMVALGVYMLIVEFALKS